MTRLFWGILLLGLVLRLLFAFSGEAASVRTSGGDEFWYLGNGLGMFQPEPRGYVYNGFPYAVNSINTPFYLLLTGFPQLFLSLEDTVRVLWILQSLLGIATAYFAYRLGWKLCKDKRAGYLAGIILALSPVMLLEPSAILTETVYLFFVLMGLWLYVEFILLADKANWIFALFVGLIWGLATLTRATSLLFPIGLIGHLLIFGNKKNWKKTFALALVLFFSYSATVSTWTIFNWLKYQRFVIASDQFMPALWRGAVEGDGSPEENDALLGEESHGEQAVEVIATDPRGFLQRRFEELLGSYLQPHGTLKLGGESLKAMADAWIRDGFSLEAFWHLLNGEAFWPKLLIYILHYGAIIGAILSLWFLHNAWRISLVLWGFIAYTTLLHLVVLALPRYIFPTYPLFWILAAGAIIALWDKLRGHTQRTPSQAI